MHRFERIINRLSVYTSYVAVVTLVFMFLFITVSVVSRYVLNKPVRGSVEIVELGMVAVVLLGLAYTQHAGAHVSMDVLVNRFPPKGQAVFESLGNLAGLIFCAVITWRGFAKAVTSGSINEVSLVLVIPIAPFRWIVCAGFFILGLTLLVSLVHSIQKVSKG